MEGGALARVTRVKVRKNGRGYSAILFLHFWGWQLDNASCSLPSSLPLTYIGRDHLHHDTPAGGVVSYCIFIYIYMYMCVLCVYT
jgi:hypothetical protein